MPNGDTPDHRDLWDALNQARLEIAEMKGMPTAAGMTKIAEQIQAFLDAEKK